MSSSGNTKRNQYEVDYYSLLGVPRDATTEEINRSFRRLAKTFHPDKFADKPEERDMAEARFIQLREAADTLTDETKRRIYDMYGIKGLMNMQVGEKLKTVEEIMHEYQKLNKRREDAFLARRVAPHGVFSAKFDATDLLFFYSPSVPTIEQFHLQQRIKIPLTSKDSIIAKGEITSYRGAASADITTRYEKQISPRSSLSLAVRNSYTHIPLDQATNILLSNDQASISMLHRVLKFSFWRRFSPNLEGTARWTIPILPTLNARGAKSSLEFELVRSLAPNWTGVAQWVVGNAARVSVRRSFEKAMTQVTMEVMQEHIAVIGQVNKEVSKHTLVQGTVIVSLHNIAGIIGGFIGAISRKISQLSKIAVSCFIGWNGVEVTITYSRFGQKFNFPIKISPQFTLVSGVIGLVSPIALAAMAKFLWLDPAKRRKEQRKIERMRREREAFIRKQKAAAEQYCTLMKETVERKIAEEEKKGGLIIVHASYGKLSVEQSTMNNDDEKNPYVVDVTMPVQFFVENSQLHLPPTTKSGLAGFYDPCPGEEKFLEVIYLFKNKLHRVVVADTQPLRAPLQAHLSPEATE